MLLYYYTGVSQITYLSSSIRNSQPSDCRLKTCTIDIPPRGVAHSIKLHVS